MAFDAMGVLSCNHQHKRAKDNGKGRVVSWMAVRTLDGYTVRGRSNQ